MPIDRRQTFNMENLVTTSKNNSQNITTVPINSSSCKISRTIRQPSTSQKFKPFNKHNNFDDENVTDYFNTQFDQSNFDDKYVIGDSDTQMNEFENYDDNVNMEETSSHTEIIEDSLQEYNELVSNKALIVDRKNYQHCNQIICQ
ncbi:hypothetical protein C2G38_2029199 [Gigaspora rosea]|uniref:Uncharacterized protein n=1 Tax=Gigaspora rosea TaxID=44941 RepID=A0A397VYN9_9GLOM|nr:hypothetical protein C2G38_2029199 [Gigaspora rosea]